ncbi:hypothetical protein, partial [Phenylobacterium sp. Root77]|uniref:hypothetical protein n=1 Tax=Phenylobacterium sp. Root77 TaxID=1736599 RepID=UPI001F3E990B
ITSGRVAKSRSRISAADIEFPTARSNFPIDTRYYGNLESGNSSKCPGQRRSSRQKPHIKLKENRS